MPQFYRHADCALLVYDVTDRDSFRKLDYWLSNLNMYCNRDDCMKILIGNKKDLLSDRSEPPVRPEEVRRWIR